VDVQKTSQWNIFKANASIKLYIKVEVENNMMMGDLQSNPHQLGFRKGEMKTSLLSNKIENKKQFRITIHHKTPKNFVASFGDNK
jgi:hypothetical protein